MRFCFEYHARESTRPTGPHRRTIELNRPMWIDFFDHVFQKRSEHFCTLKTTAFGLEAVDDEVGTESETLHLHS